MSKMSEKMVKKQTVEDLIPILCDLLEMDWMTWLCHYVQSSDVCLAHGAFYAISDCTVLNIQGICTTVDPTVDHYVMELDTQFEEGRDHS